MRADEDAVYPHDRGQKDFVMMGRGTPPGAGVLQWLMDDAESDGIESSRGEGVQFIGTRGLLELRGGGQAEVHDGDGSEDDMTERERPCQAGEFRQAISLWDALRLDAEEDRWQRQWLDEHVGGGTLQRKGVIVDPHVALITGTNQGRAIIVCPTCQRDKPATAGEWIDCICGARACYDCVGARCGACGRPLATLDGFPRFSTDNTDDVTADWHDPFHWHGPNAVDLHTDDAPADLAEPSAEDQGDVPRACDVCSTDLSFAGAEWRICSCRATRCIGCWMAWAKCPTCDRGGDGQEGDRDGPSHHRLYHDGSDSSAVETASSAHEPEHLGDHELDGPTIQHDETPLEGERPQVVSPAEADRLRDLRRQRLDAELLARRVKSRAQAKWQLKEGARPRRAKNRNRVDVVTMNANCANRFRDEISLGGYLDGTDIVLAQELRLQGKAADSLASWLRGLGWDPVLEDAYLKHRDLGGGTAVAMRGNGLRPLDPPPNELRGRIAWAEADLRGSVVIGSVYATSGQCAGRQLPLWKHIVQRLTTWGLPFILGGDWQHEPRDLMQSGLPELLDATIIAAGCSTNTQSGNELDYFLVSRTLVTADTHAVIEPAGNFSPHVAVRLVMGIPRDAGTARRLHQPRTLPKDRIFGPAPPPQYFVDWSGWENARRGDPHLVTDAAAVERLTREWYAGAELELIQGHGLRPEEAASYSGLGTMTVTVRTAARGRYRNVADELGLMGQRLGWAAKGIWTVLSAMQSPLDSRFRQRSLDLGWRFSRRARALRREHDTRHRSPEFEKEGDLLRRALVWLGNVSLQIRGGAPLLVRLVHQDCDRHAVDARQLYDDLNGLIKALAGQRRKRALRQTREWARAAPERVGHRVTKSRETTVRKSASADKGHRGEYTDQAAADAGLVEWGDIWHSTSIDHGDIIIDQIERIYKEKEDHDHDEVALPSITDESILRGALKFRSDTAVGVDGVRPRHLARLSKAARWALAHLLRIFEGNRRWASILREVVEVALAKKAGGARLVGLGPSLYRLWARIRFDDVRDIIEQRIERHYLPAAPGQGSVRAVFDMALTTETARAQGKSAATTNYDLSKYYEHIDISEFAVGARRFGLPLTITSLLAHLYVGPRRIRVGEVVSRTTFPRRSILAGCTFALMVIRLITIKPAELLLKLIAARTAGWDLRVRPTFYVDDGVITSVGSLDAVGLLHGWVSRLVINWVRHVLKKDLAHHKSSCVASSAEVRERIRGDMEALNIPVTLEGEMLGVDYAAGGALRRRRLQTQRTRKAAKRRFKLAWWRKVGGKATKVAKTGALPEQAFGSEVVGMPPAALRDARRIHAATTSVQCGGASTTAKLALGGEDLQEHDPGVMAHNPPLRILLKQIWDKPQCRADVARSWYKAREDVDDHDHNRIWQNVHGPVGAAMAHLRRIGAGWPKAFKLQALGQTIDILKTPPKQVDSILQLHARRHYDHMMLRRLSIMNDWNIDEVMKEYRFGVHWDLLRKVIKGKCGWLSPKEKRVLQVVTAGGFWPEHRRWMCGISPSATCSACGLTVGTNWHRVHDCPAADAERARRRAAGEAARLPPEAFKPGLAPLLHMGLPPQPLDWVCDEVEYDEGSLGYHTDGFLYGDGSGYEQQHRNNRHATWSLIRMSGSEADGWRVSERMAGTVAGWYPTVARGELSALIRFLRHGSLRASYVGDCRYVIEGARYGVSSRLRSSASLDADLWQIVHSLVRDHGTLPRLIKSKAHRSRRQALQDEEDDIVNWMGNKFADEAAKTLARDRARLDPRAELRAKSEAISITIIRAVAQGAAFAVSNWPETAPATGTRGPRTPASATIPDDDCDERHIVRRTDNGNFECTICRKLAYTVAGARKLQMGICGGSIHDAIHHSHSLSVSHGVTWCQRCGAFSTRWPRQLVLPCKGRPGTVPQRNVLRRLLGGLPPTTASYLQEVAQASGRPVTSTDNITTIAAPGVPEHNRNKSVGVYQRLPRTSSASSSTVRVSSGTTPGSCATSHPPPSAAVQLSTDDPTVFAAARAVAAVPSASALSSSSAKTEHGSRRRLTGKTRVDAVGRHDHSVDISPQARGGTAVELCRYDILVPGAGVRHWLEDEQGVEAAEKKLLNIGRKPEHMGQKCGVTADVSAEEQAGVAQVPRPSLRRASSTSAGTPSQQIWPRLPRRTATTITADSNTPMKQCERSSEEAHWIRQVATNRMNVASSCNVCGSLTRLRCRACVRALCIECVKSRNVCRPSQGRLHLDVNNSSMAPE